MRLPTIALRSIATCAALLTGCSTANYHGASPSSRTFSESPAIHDYYLGMNLNFTLDQPDQYHHVSPVDTGSLAATEFASPTQASITPGPGID